MQLGRVSIPWNFWHVSAIRNSCRGGGRDSFKAADSGSECQDKDSSN